MVQVFVMAWSPVTLTRKLLSLSGPYTAWASSKTSQLGNHGSSAENYKAENCPAGKA
jgi:hypothetical protein